MPKANFSETLSRQWELLKLLPSRPPGAECSELRAQLELLGFPVTKRTVERDLNELSAVFPIHCNTAGVPYGWRLIKEKAFDIPGMDLHEAMALGMLEDLMRQLLPVEMADVMQPRFDQASRKLRALPRNGRAKWRDFCRYVPPGVSFIPPHVDEEVASAIREALLNRKQLEVEYRPAGADDFKSRRLHPLGMIQQGVRTYLIATAYDYDNVLNYALHRIHSAEVMDDEAKRPKGWNLGDYISKGGGQFGEGKEITLRARVSDELANLLEETPLGSDQKITGSKGMRKLVVKVIDSWQLLFWILSQGPAITVTSPKRLKDEVIERHQEALANYK